MAQGEKPVYVWLPLPAPPEARWRQCLARGAMLEEAAGIPDLQVDILSDCRAQHMTLWIICSPGPAMMLCQLVLCM